MRRSHFHIPILSLRLWQRLQRPYLRHPVYHLTLQQPPLVMPWYLACGAILLLPGLLMVALVFISSLYGLRWAMQIAVSLARQREDGTYDQWAVTPHGGLGVGMAVASAHLERSQSLRELNRPGVWFMRAILLMVGGAVAVPFLAVLVQLYLPGGYRLLSLHTLLPLLISLTLVVYTDHVHSIVLGVILGLLLPHFAARRGDAAAAVFAVYVTLQVASYALTALLASGLFGAALALMAANPGLAELLINVLPLSVAVFFWLLREAVIRFCWSRLLHETNTAASDLAALSLPGQSAG